MTTVYWIAIAVLLLVITSLVSGVISMAHGGEYDRKHATQFMFLRVGLQALAVVLVMQLAYMSYV